MIETFNSAMQLYIGTAPFEINLVLRDMKARKLDDIEEFTELESKKKHLMNPTTGNDFVALKATIFTLIDVYGVLERCNQLLLQREMDTLFSKYVGERK